jgi:hypothetical protein
MKNSELIEALSKLPGGLEVHDLHEGYAYYPVRPPVLRYVGMNSQISTDADPEAELVIALDGDSTGA